MLRRLFTQKIALPTTPQRIAFEFASPVLSPRRRTALSTALAEFESHPALAATEVQIAIGDCVWPEFKVECLVDDVFDFAPANADALVDWPAWPAWPGG